MKPCPPHNKHSPFYTVSNFCGSDFCNYGNWHPDCKCCTSSVINYPNLSPVSVNPFYVNPCDKNPIGCWICPQENSQQVMATYSCRKITNTPTNNWHININDLLHFELLNQVNWIRYSSESDCNANSGCKRKQNRRKYNW